MPNNFDINRLGQGGGLATWYGLDLAQEQKAQAGLETEFQQLLNMQQELNNTMLEHKVPTSQTGNELQTFQNKANLQKALTEQMFNEIAATENQAEYKKTIQDIFQRTGMKPSQAGFSGNFAKDKKRASTWLKANALNKEGHLQQVDLFGAKSKSDMDLAMAQINAANTRAGAEIQARYNMLEKQQGHEKAMAALQSDDSFKKLWYQHQHERNQYGARTRHEAAMGNQTYANERELVNLRGDIQQRLQTDQHRFLEQENEYDRIVKKDIANLSASSKSLSMDGQRAAAVAKKRWNEAAVAAGRPELQKPWLASDEELYNDAVVDPMYDAMFKVIAEDPNFRREMMDNPVKAFQGMHATVKSSLIASRDPGAPAFVGQQVQSIIAALSSGQATPEGVAAGLQQFLANDQGPNKQWIVDEIFRQTGLSRYNLGTPTTPNKNSSPDKKILNKAKSLISRQSSDQEITDFFTKHGNLIKDDPELWDAYTARIAKILAEVEKAKRRVESRDQQ
jgi:hypothetical protein